MTTDEFITHFKPCVSAAAWLRTQPDPDTAWATCERPDWMLCVLNKQGLLTERMSVDLSCRFVRETPLPDGRFVVDLLKDERLLRFLELKERWVKEGGEKPLE